jgi:hypothetical protein
MNLFYWLLQVCFNGKPLPQELSYEILCLIPKSECGKYHGIVLFEVIYKVISTIILMCIEDQVKFHTGIHGFQHTHGTSTCILEAKLRIQLASYLCQPLYQIFLDLMKAYDTLDQKCTLSLLKAYGLRLHSLLIIESVWEWETLVPKSGNCYHKIFNAHHGAQQGDVISPIIFNCVVDAMLLKWDICVAASNLTGLSIFFYADDGHIDGDNNAMVQEGLNIIVGLFH